MRKTVFEIGVAVAAAALTLLLTSWVGLANGTWKVIIVVVVAIVAFLAAWLAMRKSQSAAKPGVSVGNRIKAKKNIDLSGIRVGSGADDTSVGDDLRAGENAKISDVEIGGSEPKKEGM